MPSQADPVQVTDVPPEPVLRGRLLIAVPGTLGVIFALIAWFYSFDLHPDDTGYPRVLATVLLVLGVWNIAADLRARAVEGAVDEEYGALATGRVISFAILVAVSIWLVTPIGFYPAAAIVIIGGLAIMGVRRPLVLIGYPVVLLALGYVLFSVLLKVPLPLARGF
jgi:putative tricarboxylic transport membrane protein